MITKTTKFNKRPVSSRKRGDGNMMKSTMINKQIEGLLQLIVGRRVVLAVVEE